MRLVKPSFAPFLSLQDDHYRRFADLSFRHLGGAWENHQAVEACRDLACIQNTDARFGHSEHLSFLGRYQAHLSEEYSQASVSVLLSHTWLLSAANYFRLSAKHVNKQAIKLSRTDTPKVIAEALDVQNLNGAPDRLHGYRNTLMHLVENDPKTKDIGAIDFIVAYEMAKCVWDIYCAVLVNYQLVPDDGSWEIQTKRYGLPSSVDKVKESTASAELEGII